jgi:cysteine-S-conjugate beta-lyase
MSVLPFDSPFDAVTWNELRARRSAKWSVYGPDVLPAWVAETDFPLAEPIRRELHAAIERGDAGYATRGDLGAAFAAWAALHWGWALEPRDVRLVVDVVTGIAEVLRVATAPGDRVVIDPPVYPPFAGTIEQLGRVVEPVPLASDGNGWTLDLDAVARAYRAGAKVHLLCSPHNPTGIVHSRETLRALGELAHAHDVWVLSDEVHAPLTLPGNSHVPFAAVSEAAAARAIVFMAASKTWNLAGLKAAMLVAVAEAPRALLARLPADLPYHAGHFGVLAACAAFREGEPYRDELLRVLDRNRYLLQDCLQRQLPAVRYVPPQAGYLAWLDFRALGVGNDPAQRLLERGRVALSSGPSFGLQGQGFARLNIGTTAALLEEAVARIASALA